MANKLYKHILLATDLSKNADTVAKRAASIAALSKAKLSVTHVLAHTPIAYAGEFSIPIDADFEMAIEREAKARLAKLGKKYNISGKSQFLDEGSVKTAVIDRAKKIKADLIIVGTHSHEGFDKLLGSQANAILHVAKCDVIVVRIK